MNPYQVTDLDSLLFAYNNNIECVILESLTFNKSQMRKLSKTNMHLFKLMVQRQNDGSKGCLNMLDSTLLHKAYGKRYNFADVIELFYLSGNIKYLKNSYVGSTRDIMFYDDDRFSKEELGEISNAIVNYAFSYRGFA